jgi:hypothetical protein
MFFRTANTRTKQLEVQQFLARLANQGAMARVRRLEEHRDESRTALNIGVWVVPMQDNVPQIEGTFVALASDLSSKGLAIVTNHDLSSSEVLVCFAGNTDETFLRAKVCNNKELGLGWLRVGLEACELLETGQHPRLRELERVAMG